MSATTIEITEQNFQQTVEGNGIVVLDFWAPWCAPCRAFGPTFEKVAKANPDMVFGKVNTEEQQGLAGAFAIRSIPTLMVFRDQILIFSQPGMLPEKVLSELLAKVKELDMDEVRAQIAKEQAKTKSDPQQAAAPAN